MGLIAYSKKKNNKSYIFLNNLIANELIQLPVPVNSVLVRPGEECTAKFRSTERRGKLSAREQRKSN